MTRVIDKRVTAAIEGDFVVFLIGMRINKLWKVRKWLPVFLAMPRMIRELERRPESGFLGAKVRGKPAATDGGPVLALLRAARGLRAQQGRRATGRPGSSSTSASGSSGDVGIWHETYLVPAGGFDSVYNNMPPVGLGAVTELVPAAGRRATAAGRAGIRDEPYPEGAPTEKIDI